MSALELDGVDATFGATTAVADVSLSVERGEVVCLLGPSGCGKSTTLRTVAGLETPTAGRVHIDGTDVTGTPPERRDCSLVFQDWALFPNMTVFENVAFALKTRDVPAPARRERVDELLSLVEMAERADATPDALSGGQKQRIALARSLAFDPTVLLLDEPLSNLDRTLKETMQVELLEIQQQLGTTMLYVTHDQDEAFTLADRIGVMRDGRLVQVGAPSAVYDDPATQFVESFLGSTTFVECRVEGGASPGSSPGPGPESEPVLRTPVGAAPLERLPARLPPPGETVVVSVRPDALVLEPQASSAPSARAAGASGAVAGQDDPTATGGTDGDHAGVGAGSDEPPTTGDAAGRAVTTDERERQAATETRVTLESVLRRGSSVRYQLSTGSTTLFADRPVADQVEAAVGESVTVRWLPERSRYFDAGGERLR